MAELVIADAPFKKYPGGVIVLRASDWLGPARGTLSTEADSRSCAGTVVRDTQLVSVPSGNIFNDLTAMGDAEDTLQIDLSQLPVESEMRYTLVFSALIEGDWNPTNITSNRNTVCTSLGRAAALHWFGDSLFFLSESDFAVMACYPRLMQHYVLTQSNGIIGDVVGNEVIHIRAYGMDGTTIEWLLDQVYLMPHTGGSTDGWTFQDFVFLDGAYADSTDKVFNDEHIDGADGGDLFGKFTVHPQNFAMDGAIPFYGDPGGGDYQRKVDADDAEYYIEITDADFRTLLNSATDAQGTAHAYGAHGHWLTSPILWVDDPFDRTLNDGDFSGADDHFSGFTWGDTPEGITWHESPNSIRRSRGPFTDTSGTGLRYGASMWTDGAGKAWMHVRRKAESDSTPSTAFLETWMGPGGSTDKGYLALDNLSITGKFTLEEQSSLPTTGSALPYIMVGTNTDQASVFANFGILWDITTRTWSVNQLGPIATIHGPVDISGWWADGVAVAWRLEIQRYVLRVKVWEASDPEPSSWDYEDFRAVKIGPSTYDDYNYADDLGTAWNEVDELTFQCQINTGVLPGVNIENLKVSWEDIKIQTNLGDDELGSIDNATTTFFQMEKPKGTPVGDIEIPVGAQYLVYWGARIWTVVDEFDEVVLAWAMKAWNPTDAPLMQRAETSFWWFRSVHGGLPTIVRYR